MNKNKTILGAVIAITVIIIVLLFQTLNSKNDKKQMSKPSGSDFLIWTVGDESSGMDNVITEFKKLHSSYAKATITVENFSSYTDYYSALNSALIKGKMPDVFVLNNNEKKPLYEDQTMGISPTIVHPNDFRKLYKGVFGDDLIVSSGEGEEKVEFLKGLPIGYETLGIYYNKIIFSRAKVNGSDLNSFSGLNNVIGKLKEKYPNNTPIGIGNGSNVHLAPDIMSQFFMLSDGVEGVEDVVGNKLKESLSLYMLFGDTQGTNGFNLRTDDLRVTGKNNLDLFSEGEAFMIVGYPRTLLEIEKKGYGKGFLSAVPFPHHHSGNGNTFLNYNYFVINKDTKNIDLANSIVTHLSSDSGALKYLSEYPYYLPARISLESDKLEAKILDKYDSVILEGFYNSDFQLKSFDKGVKNIYDREILSVLDSTSNYDSEFKNFKDSLFCRKNKIINLSNFETSCE